MSDPYIIEAWITNLPRPNSRVVDSVPEVHAKFNDGRHVVLFSYYPDEISFTANEFIGLTEAEAHALRARKDVEYLKSP